ncbi:penicillin-binding protein [Bacillus gaemokensis]|nr:penicillin-binding protein [Bacillus gaemokensis]
MLHIKTKVWTILAILFILSMIVAILFATNFISFSITTSPPERGKIFDENGVILATNKKVKNELIRVYPQHEIASQVIGYVDSEKNNSYSNYVPAGRNGIELQYENDLKGIPGKTLLFKIKDKKFLWNIQSPQKGKDIQLALDYKLQQKTEEALRSQIKNTRDANAGYAVVIDVKTGKILTMANSSAFDPNRYLSSLGKENIKRLSQNKTIQKLKYGESYVNMASTIKPLTILIGLNEKLFQPADTYLDTGSFQYNDQNNVTNAAGTPTGEITPSQAITNSSNTFMTAKVAIPLFNKNNGSLEKVSTTWTNYLKQFGLRSKSGVDLPFEEEGQYQLHASSKFESGISALLNASWGGNEVHTPLQLAQYAATLASKGDKYKSQIANAIIDNDGKGTKKLKPILESSNRYPLNFWSVLQDGMSHNIQEIKNLPFEVLLQFLN